ncbi:hypothetical protein GGR54DRAFT_364671 [Hypoxylon sp. NC1633]|nr:hypothetical protein GGR54DRAFT_364671 [Hypoxylon sp. NC1633]
MPQDPNLHGQRPAKRQKKEISLSSSLDFASQLTSILANPSSSSSSAAVASGRPRPSKTKDDIFSVKAKRKAGPAADNRDKGEGSASKDGSSSKISLKEPRGTEEEKQDLTRARRKMEEKARLYAAMKRGDYIAKDGETAPLVDFDRKWAEKHPDDDNDPNKDRYSSSGTDDESDDDNYGAANSQELVDYTDEFGRTRKATRAEVSRLQRRQHRSALGAAELESMAAQPLRAPEDLIFSDVIQAAAFAPEDGTLSKMEDLAARRDREPTPPPDAHFDGGAEIRTKGVGFYQFSKDEQARAAEMAGLAAERENTERVRGERERARETRRREIEERRQRIGAKRAERLADHFLDGLAGEFGAVGAGSGSGGGEERGKREEEEKEKEKERGKGVEKD